MKPVAAVVAITVLLLTGLPLAGPAFSGTADAQLPARVGSLRLDLTQLEPRVVTADGPNTLVVSGRITNTGTVDVDGLVVRVQRGDPLGTEGALRDALDGTAGTDAVTPQFLPLHGALAPGSSMSLRFTVALRGAPTTSLALTRTGVHEVLVNVNGVPAGGPRARLAAARLLLPVVSLPPDATTPVTPPPPGPPAPFSLLYPIIETPRRLSTVQGEPMILTDDGLAASMAPGGRLGGLVSALAGGAPAGSRVRAATCVAIDPDLVETAVAMTDTERGYAYRAPDGTLVRGGNGPVAAAWLAQLTAAVRGGCVVSLPYADADLVAMTRGGLGERATSAISGGRGLLADLLQTPVVAGTTWPVEGVVDDATLDRISQAAGRSVLLSADGVTRGRTPRSTGVVALAGTSQFAVLTDPLLARAAAGPPDRGLDASRGAAAPADSPAGTDQPLSTQDTIGTLAFRSATTTADGAPLVLAPPHRWAADATGATALLDAVATLVDAGRITPRDLGAVLVGNAPTGAPTEALAYPLETGGREVSADVVATVRRTADAVTDLRSAAVDGSVVGLSPAEAFTPLERGLVRPLSSAWRGRPDDGAAAAAAGADRIGDLRALVRVLEPPSPYSLGTSDAPLLFTVANGLPVTVRVRLEIASTSGLRVAPIEPPDIPPLGRRQIRVSAEVVRSGQFTVQASVRTPDGGLLGPPSRLRVRSTAYGTITVWLTASAGVLLVVLAGRRVVRRIRHEPPGRRPVRPRGPAGRPDRTSTEQRATGGLATEQRTGRKGSPGAGSTDPTTGDPFPELPTDRLPRPPGPGRPPPRVPSP